MEVETTGYMQEAGLPPQPESTVTTSSSVPTQPRQLNRQQRRAQDKKAAVDMQRLRKGARSMAESRRALVNDLLKVYEDGYNEYLKQDPQSEVSRMQIALDINPTEIPLKDLIDHAANSTSMAGFEQYLVPNKPGMINVMYLRVQLHFTLKPGITATTRPGVPEMIEPSADGDVVAQLFYHAVHPLQPVSGNKDQDELYANRSIDKLFADFIVEVFSTGMDATHARNKDMWAKMLSARSKNIQAKADEITEMFEHAKDVNPDSSPLKVAE